MSLQLFGEDVIFLQRFLKCCAFYNGNGKIDGIWGSKTDDAFAQFDAESAAIAAELGTFDIASERYVRTLQPKTQREARAFLTRVLQWGGDWTSFVDEPHYQLATGVTLAVVRTSFEVGEAFV